MHGLNSKMNFSFTINELDFESMDANDNASFGLETAMEKREEMMPDNEDNPPDLETLLEHANEKAEDGLTQAHQHNNMHPSLPDNTSNPPTLTELLEKANEHAETGLMQAHEHMAFTVESFIFGEPPENPLEKAVTVLEEQVNTRDDHAQQGLGKAIDNIASDFDTGEHHQPDHTQGGKGNGDNPGPVSTPIDLFSVVLHEIGHAINLEHTSLYDATPSIMKPYYQGPQAGLFDKDIADIQALLPEDGSVNNTGWDDLDGDGIVEVTYSFMPDRSKMESGISNLFKSMDKHFDSTETWQGIVRDAFDAWENATKLDNADDGDVTHNIELKFVEVVDEGLPFNFFGDDQNDSRAGDIRIGTHKFDGAEGTLAHTYFPPPNGGTAAGDIHLDPDEMWF